MNKKTLVTGIFLLFSLSEAYSSTLLGGISFLKRESKCFDTVQSFNLDSEGSFIMSGISGDDKYLIAKFNPTLRYIIGEALIPAPGRTKNSVLSTSKDNEIILALSGEKGLYAVKYSPRLDTLTDRQLTHYPGDYPLAAYTDENDQTFILYAGIRDGASYSSLIKLNSYLYPVKEIPIILKENMSPQGLIKAPGGFFKIASSGSEAYLSRYSSELMILSSYAYSPEESFKSVFYSPRKDDGILLVFEREYDDSLIIDIAVLDRNFSLISSTSASLDPASRLKGVGSDIIDNTIILTENDYAEESSTLKIRIFSPDFELLAENLLESTSLYDRGAGVAVDKENNIFIASSRVVREYGEPDDSSFLAIKLRGAPLPSPETPAQTGELRVSGGGEDPPINTARGERSAISYKLTAPGEVTIIVYNQSGDPVWERSFEAESAEGSLEWDGRRANGTLLPGGSYILHFRGPGLNTTRSISISN